MGLCYGLKVRVDQSFNQSINQHGSPPQNQPAAYYTKLASSLLLHGHQGRWLRLCLLALLTVAVTHT